MFASELSSYLYLGSFYIFRMYIRMYIYIYIFYSKDDIQILCQIN